MKIKFSKVFDNKGYISITLLPLINFDYGNFYKYYDVSIDLGWLCFYISFEFKIKKNKT